MEKRIILRLWSISSIKTVNLVFLSIALLILTISTGTATGDTIVGGVISTDTTWTLAGSPYIVNSSITVQGTSGADGITTLTIEPGVHVKINPNISTYISVGAASGNPGALQALGTSSDPIIFTSNAASPAPGNWTGIKILNTSHDSGTSMNHCIVRYAGYGQGSILIDQASPTISNTTVEYSSNYDLYYTGVVGGVVSGCTFNSGIYLLSTSTVSFSGNTFNQNDAYPTKANANNVHSIVNGNSFLKLTDDS